MEEFRRLTRLPAYVFNITSELKAAARKRGEDIIDFGMGNPDGATPKHIVDKLIEAAQRTATHRYSLSRGVPRLRRAICNWYKRRYDVDAGKDAIAKVAQKTGVTYPILLTDGKIQKAYGGPDGMDYLPMSFYIDKNGVIVEETAGLGSKDEIEAHIKKIVASGATPTAGGQ